jgi:Ca2+-binding RTX toxin-like protein
VRGSWRRIAGLIAAISVTAEGLAGDDTVTGDDRLLGGPGADRFYSTFFFDGGDDAYDGGPGRDRALFLLLQRPGVPGARSA